MSKKRDHKKEQKPGVLKPSSNALKVLFALSIPSLLVSVYFSGYFTKPRPIKDSLKDPACDDFSVTEEFFGEVAAVLFLAERHDKKATITIPCAKSIFMHNPNVNFRLLLELPSNVEVKATLPPGVGKATVEEYPLCELKNVKCSGWDHAIAFYQTSVFSRMTDLSYILKYYDSIIDTQHIGEDNIDEMLKNKKHRHACARSFKPGWPENIVLNIDYAIKHLRRFKKENGSFKAAFEQLHTDFKKVLGVGLTGTRFSEQDPTYEILSEAKVRLDIERNRHLAQEIRNNYKPPLQLVIIAGENHIKPGEQAQIERSKASLSAATIVRDSLQSSQMPYVVASMKQRP